MLTISLDGNFEAALQRQIDALSSGNLETAMAAAGRAAGVAAESVISPYPPPSGRPLDRFYQRTNAEGKTYLSKFKSRRQQGYVLSLAARGLIPRRRTGQLGRSITSDVRDVSADGVTVVVGTNLNYAPFVIDRYRMSAYHKGTWTPLQDDVERGLPIVIEAANRAFIIAIRKLL